MWLEFIFSHIFYLSFPNKRKFADPLRIQQNLFFLVIKNNSMLLEIPEKHQRWSRSVAKQVLTCKSFDLIVEKDQHSKMQSDNDNNTNAKKNNNINNTNRRPSNHGQLIRFGSAKSSGPVNQ